MRKVLLLSAVSAALTFSAALTPATALAMTTSPDSGQRLGTIQQVDVPTIEVDATVQADGIIRVEGTIRIDGTNPVVH